MALKISPLQMKEYGVVMEIKQDIAHVVGLTNCMNGQLVHFVERHQIEGRPAQMIANNLIGAFDQYCN